MTTRLDKAGAGDLEQLAIFKQMENEKNVTVIGPSAPVFVKPLAEVIKVKPSTVITIKPAPMVIIKPQAVSVVKIQPARSVTVTPPRRGAWDERGWMRSISGGSEIYEGYYAVGEQRFRGRVEVRGRNIAVYIYNPPREIKSHSHGACFQLVSNGWFHLHWSRAARNVDDAILYMERVLDESING